MCVVKRGTFEMRVSKKKHMGSIIKNGLLIVITIGVFNQLMAKGDYKATPFVISKELASRQVYPIINRDDFSYKFSRGIKRIFN